MSKIPHFFNKILGRKTTKTYHCFHCHYSWETDEEYPSCPVCATKNVHLVK